MCCFRFVINLLMSAKYLQEFQIPLLSSIKPDVASFGVFQNSVLVILPFICYDSCCTLLKANNAGSSSNGKIFFNVSLPLKKQSHEKI